MVIIGDKRATPELRSFSLDDSYRPAGGGRPAYLTGVRAIVRLLLDQRRRDQAAGLDTRAFVSGYEGSPLAGLDLELGRQQSLLAEHGIVFSPGLNEEAGAMAVQGTQLASVTRGARHDGVTGVWYGKAPGLDRASDALRHANLMGTHHRGGALALVGDDPAAKSSTVPSGSEATLADLAIPTLYPADPAEIVELGLHAVALSRAAGVWAALKIVTAVADGAMSAELGGFDSVLPDMRIDGKPWRHTVSGHLLQPAVGILERDLHGARLEIARRYAAANGLNRIVRGGGGDEIGLVASGKTWLDLRQALAALNLDDDALRLRGIRLLKLGMVWPLEPADRARIRYRAARDRGRRGTARVPRVRDQGRALRDARRAGRARQARPGRRPAVRRDRRTRFRRDRGGTRAAARRPGAGPPPADLADARAHPAHALLLLGLPAQHLHQAGRGLPGRRRHRLSRHGAADGRQAGRRGDRADADGRRGHPVDRDGTVRRCRALRAEPRRRHLPPLRFARRPCGRGLRREHHLQAAAQRHRRHDRRAGCRRRPLAAADHPAARGGRGGPHHRDRGRSQALSRRAVPRRGPGVGPEPARRGAAGARRGPRGDRAHPRPGVRRGEAPQAQARHAAHARHPRHDQRAGLRGLRRLRREVELPVGAAGRHRVRPQDPHRPVVVQPRLLLRAG